MYVGISLRSQDYGVYSEVGYICSPDTGQTWESYRVIAKQSEATPNIQNMVPFPFGKDEIHLTWHDPRRMHMWSSDGGVTWSNPSEIIQLGAGFGGANYLAKIAPSSLCRYRRQWRDLRIHVCRFGGWFPNASRTAAFTA